MWTSTEHLLGPLYIAELALHTTVQQYSTPLLLLQADLLELISQTEQPQQFNITHCWLKMVVESRQCGVSDVVVTGNATQVCNLEGTSAPVISAEHTS